ncbi:hypothetical protein ACFCX0_41380 [Streptomyces sp. NPDC056352]|uniref:hypothetical protein n=1 Tax=Streptomyces sp. NPDC056352 TaxID=3345791 RepID=UPI0035DDE02F
MNGQVNVDPFGRLLWASAALPGSVQDSCAAVLMTSSTPLPAPTSRFGPTREYRSAGGTVRVPSRGRWGSLSAGQQVHNSSHVTVRACGEQARATLRTWCCIARSCDTAPPASPTWS